MPENRSKLIEGIFAKAQMLRGVAPESLRRLARQAQLVHVAKDALLYELGDRATGCYLLSYGLMNLLLHAPGGSEKVLRLVGPGETFAESVIFHPQPHPVRARALVDSEVVFLPAEALIDLFDRDREFARKLLATLSRRIHALIADIESYALSSGTQRIAAYLVALAGPSPSAPARVSLPANKTVIASRLGITKETFSRLLHDLTSQGLIEVSRREISLPDPPRLAELARGGEAG